MKIVILNDTETIRYAADELAKYLEMMDSKIKCEIVASAIKTDDGINLGLLSDLSLPSDDVDEPMLDDVIDVRIDSLNGYITGSNGRSVLMGVYKYLKSCGCRWVRPGEDGEYIPTFDVSAHCFRFRKKADYPFRGQAIEGAVSFEHVKDTILWLPKVDMNLFQIEQVVPYFYLSRWYRNLSYTKRVSEDLPYEQYEEGVLELEKLIKKCGLQLHALGHGALNEPLGIRGLDDHTKYEVSAETKKAFALVNGKRELFIGSPFYTQLCMSQEWVQDKVVNWIADYMKEKPYIDFMHFWLADAKNNHCECEDCVKKTPCDWYVDMLNKLDAKLTEQGNDAKVVFIMYVDTLWPPVKERFNNPSRFIMTTACGSGKGYSNKRREGGIPEWKRNDYSVVGGLDMALTFIDGWKPIFDGPKFLYEYVFYTPHYADPGYMNIARKTANDMKMFGVTGLSGIMSDQTQRCAFPTALPVSIMGEFLFDVNIDTESYIDKYLQDCFGEDWKSAKEYLQKISDSFDIEALTQHTDITSQDTGVADKNSKKAGIIGNEPVGDIIAQVPKIVDAFAPTICKNLALSDKCHRLSWKLLKFHGDYCKGLTKIYYSLSRNNSEEARWRLGELKNYLSDIEEEIHPYFDIFLFEQRTYQIIAGK